MKSFPKITFIAAILLFSACTDEKEVFTKYRDINGEAWAWDSPCAFEFNIADSAYTHDFYINLRLTENYPKSNMYIQSRLITPNNDTINQLYNVLLFNNEGASLGKRTGKLFNYKEAITRNNHWENGTYQVLLTQFTREFDLNGVNAVGIDIRKGEPIF